MMLKRQIIPSLVFGLVLVTMACSSKRENDDNSDETIAVSNEEWKEMDEFHMVMAESFHPYKDSANLEPARNHADSLVSAAERWAQAPLPERFSEDDEIKFKLNQLKVDASTFADVVKTGDDKSVGQSLTKLHDLFHEIQESWYGQSE
jgi:hypothetical protein